MGKLVKNPYEKKLEEAKKKLEGKANLGPTKQKAEEIKLKSVALQPVKTNPLELTPKPTVFNVPEEVKPVSQNNNPVKHSAELPAYAFGKNKIASPEKDTEISAIRGKSSKVHPSNYDFKDAFQEHTFGDIYFNNKLKNSYNKLSDDEKSFVDRMYDPDVYSKEQSDELFSDFLKRKASGVSDEKQEAFNYLWEYHRNDTAESGRANPYHPINGVPKETDSREMRIYKSQNDMQYDKYMALSREEKEYVDFLFGFYNLNEAQSRFGAFLNEKANADLKERAKTDWTARNIEAPLKHIGANLVAGPASFVQTAIQEGKNIASGVDRNVPEYSGSVQLQKMKEAGREAFINGDEGVVGTFKDLGLGLVDTTATLAVAGQYAPFLYAAQAGGDSAYETAKKGGSNTRALAMGIGNAAVTYLTAKVGVEKLIFGKGGVNNSTRKEFTGSLKQFVAKQLGTAALTEAGEGYIENFADGVLDSIINGDKSDIALNAETLMKHGYSREDAFRMAISNKFVKEGFFSALSEGLGGLILGGGHMGINMYQGYRNYKNSGGVSYIYNGIEVNDKTTAEDVLGQLNGMRTGEDVQYAFDNEYAQGVLDAARGEMEAIPEGTRKMMDFYSKFANVRFVVGDTAVIAGQKAAGAYVNSADVILMDFDTVQDSNEVARKIVNHELTHSAERSKHYDALKEYAFGHMFNESNTLDSAIAKKIDRYGKRGVTLDTTGAEAELVAEYMGKLMSSPEAVEKMVMENKPLAKSVLDSLVETYKKVTTYFKDKDAYEARYALSDIEQGIRLFEKALKTRTSVSDAIARGMGIDTRAMGESDGGVQFSLSPTKRARLENYVLKLGQSNIKKSTGDKEIKILTDRFSVNKAIYSKKGRTEREVNARIKAIPDFEKIITESKYSHTDTDITGIDKDAKKNVVAMHYFETTYKDFDVEIVIRDKGKQQFLYEIKFIENKKNSQQSMPNNIGSPAPKGDVENDVSISQITPDVNSDLKQKQFEIISQNNPANNTYSTWIRSVDDIKTLQETLEDSDWVDYDEFAPDLTKDMIKDAIESGKITVYSSHSIEQGIFVSPSKMEAQGYSANGKVHQKEVGINDVAWISPLEGQYAKVQFAAPVASTETETKNDIKISSNKAKNYYDRYVRTAKKDIGKIFSIPGARLSALDGNFDTLAGEYFHTGKISESSKEALFEKAWKEGIIIDDTNKDFAKALRKDLKSSTLYISPEDAKDIPDFGVWRRSQIGNMMLSTQSGYSVDSKYQELNAEYGDNYFPLNITAPSDRLMRIAEVMEKLKPLEYTLEEREAQFKEDYRKEFMKGLGEFEKRLSDVSRYEKARELSDVQNVYGRDELTVDEANAIYDELKGLRKNYDKVVAKELLTPADQKKVEQVLAGDLDIEDIKGTKFNIEGIKKVVEAKAPIKLLTDSLERHKNAVKKRRFETAEKFLKGSDLWKEKKFGVSYAAETMERNFYDIMGKGSEKQAKELIDHYFTPVHEHEAQSIRNKNNYRQRVANLGLSQKIEKGNKTSESFAVQFLGEVESDLEMLTSRKYISEKAKAKINELKKQKEIFLRENPNLDYNKINSAIAEFRTIYDELFVEMNGARIRNGYAPVEYRKGYFPHFLTDAKKGINKELAQELGIGEYEAKGGIFEKFTKALGISTDVNNLPTNIAGKTQDFKPGIKFMSEALQRKTDETDYDALAGFDRYIESVSDVIYHTDDIQELRALERQLRYEYSEAGVKERIDALRDDATLPEDVKNDALEKLYERNITKHGGLVQEISEYTNLLANKKSKYDRTIEGLLNRKVYNVLNWANKNVAGNMIAGNLSSAMTNVIPITQASAECSQASIIKAMRDTVKNYLHNDGFEDASTFLTNRRGSDLLTKSTSTKISDALSIPMELADMFTANVVTRAKFYENIKNGMDADAAIKDADKYAAGLIADRSKGALPTVFGAKNPIAKTFTMFQVEVNNQYGYLLKDMPRAKRGKAVGAIAGALLKYFIGAYLFNDVYEKLVGRRPALDAIGFANEIAGDFFGGKFNNSIDIVNGLLKGEFGTDTWFDTPEKKKPSEALKNIATNVLDDTPFAGNAAKSILGLDDSGGRYPIGSAIPNLGKLAKVADGDVVWRKKGDIALKELGKTAYAIVPFGLNQAKKTYQGISTVAKGGSYSLNNKGEKVMQYPVYNDSTGETVRNYVQGALFGKSALPEAQEWRKNGFKSMSVKDTERYEKVAEKGKREETYNTLKQIGALESIKGADGKILESESKQRYELIKNANIPEGQKAWLEISYWGDKAKARADAAKSEAGISDKRYVDAKYKYAETDAEKYNPYLTKRQKKMFELTPEEEKTSDYKKFSLFNEKGLSAEQKRYLEKDLFGSKGKTDYTDKESFYLSLLSDSQNTKFKATEKALGVNAELYYTYLKIAGSGKKDEKKANLQKYGMTPAQANAFYELAIKNRKAGDVHDQTAYANLSPKEQAAYNLLKNFKEYAGMDAAEFSLFVRVASSGKTEKEKIELLRNYSLNGQKLSEIAAKGIVKILAR